MSIRLHGSNASTCSLTVLLTAAELGVDIEIVTVDFSKGEHKAPPHLKHQPFGKVPYLVDSDGTTLYESRAISRYLAVKYPKKNPNLFPIGDLKVTNH